MNLILDFLWILITLAALILIVVVIFVVTLSIRNRRDAEEARLDKQRRSPTQSVPIARTMKERLQELEALRAAGTITPEEHAARRDAILREL